MPKRYLSILGCVFYDSQYFLFLHSCAKDREFLELFAGHAAITRALRAVPYHKYWDGTNETPLKKECISWKMSHR